MSMSKYSTLTAPYVVPGLPEPDVRHFVAPDGTTLIYTTYGDMTNAADSLVVFQVSGWGLSSYYPARAFSEHLTPRGPLLFVSPRGTDIQPDLRPDKNTISTAYMAEDLEALRVHLDLPAFPVLLGHAHGGTIALTYAELYPSHVKQLILIDHRVDIALDAESNMPMLEKLSDDPRFAPSVDALFNQGPLDTDEQLTAHILSVAPAYFHDPERCMPSDLMYVARDGVPLVSAWCMSNLAECDERDKDADARRVAALPQVTARTLIIFGKQDVICSLAGAELTHRGIPGSQLHIIDGCGHAPWIEQPEELWNVIFPFLSEQ
ncbi:alpha/beta-hydrolase [Fistulina hepatica ATCC 64428]|uniref:Alpha/beta-hydrolase n=1 Tax=Fistulina hepatica ATCC 64428 TaxID=1128425 RepID=A0A0D7AGT0_9AGAR|nr:alpha/beta-hydrolase [Fistulina hepatica ATCC 64428]